MNSITGAHSAVRMNYALGLEDQVRTCPQLFRDTICYNKNAQGFNAPLRGRRSLVRAAFCTGRATGLSIEAFGGLPQEVVLDTYI